MSVNMKELLKELTALRGVSGHEQEVIEYVYRMAKEYTDKIEIDNTGNLTIHIPSKRKDLPQIAIFGHMDEIGLMVKMIDEDGFIKLERIGGIHEQVLPGSILTITTEKKKLINGIIGVRSHHVTPPEDKKRIPEISELYLDIGATSRNQAMDWGVEIGNIITYPCNWIEYGNERVSCKSIDNRVSNAIMLSLLHDLSSSEWDGPDLYLVFGVQEEFSVRGVLPAIRKINPDICIGIDITVVYDTPDSKGFGDIQVGAGPAITYLHYNEGGTLAGLTYNRKLNSHFISTAKRIGVDIQREVVIGVITETAFMTFEGEKGYICGNISIPTRNTHTPVEMISLKDAENAKRLLKEAVTGMDDIEKFKLVSLGDID